MDSGYRDSGDTQVTHPHRMLQVDPDGSYRVVGHFNNSDEARKRVATQNLKYPRCTFVYCPPSGWERYIQREFDV